MKRILIGISLFLVSLTVPAYAGTCTTSNPILIATTPAIWKKMQAFAKAGDEKEFTKMLQEHFGVGLEKGITLEISGAGQDGMVNVILPNKTQSGWTHYSFLTDCKN